jgi:TatD DNase family protein
VSIFDTHTHIGAPALADQADALLERARAAGVSGVIAVGAGWGLESNAGAIAVAHAHDDVWATVGVHPHDASQWNDTARQTLEDWLRQKRVVAVGECGLDYHYDHSPREAQRDCLRAQIRLGRQHEVPLVIHVRANAGSRAAYEDLLRIFDEEGADACGGVMHCFSGDLALAQECLKRGFDISFSGVITFKNAQDLRDVAAALPLERLLVETDSPLLAPVPHRGKPNEPAFVVHVAECLAAIRGKPLDQIAECTRERAHHLFRLGERS